MSTDNLNFLIVPHLRAMALKKNIPGWRSMTKSQLITALGGVPIEDEEPVLSDSEIQIEDVPEEGELQSVSPEPEVKSNKKSKIATPPKTKTPAGKPTLRLSVKNLKADVRKAVASCDNPLKLLHVFNTLTSDSE